jgi:hypothetical protein
MKNMNAFEALFFPGQTIVRHPADVQPKLGHAMQGFPHIEHCGSRGIRLARQRGASSQVIDL